MNDKVINVCLISGEAGVDHTMHHFDVFEPFKMLATPTMFDVTIKPETDLQKVVDYFRQTAAETKRCVAAVFVVGTNIGYVNEQVKVISNGQQFCVLDDMLRHLGFTEEEQLCVQ